MFAEFVIFSAQSCQSGQCPKQTVTTTTTIEQKEVKVQFLPPRPINGKPRPPRFLLAKPRGLFGPKAIYLYEVEASK
jgi:hypothetical protein